MQYGVEVHNLGDVDISGFSIEIVYSVDTSVGVGDTSVCTVSATPIKAGQAVGYTLECTVPSMPAGDYYAGARVDSKSQITEVNESNNTGVASGSTSITEG